MAEENPAAAVDNSAEIDRLKKEIDLLKQKNREVVELSENEKFNILEPGQIIYGPNNTILARIEKNIITDISTGEVVSE